MNVNALKLLLRDSSISVAQSTSGFCHTENWKDLCRERKKRRVLLGVKSHYIIVAPCVPVGQCLSSMGKGSAVTRWHLPQRGRRKQSVMTSTHPLYCGHQAFRTHAVDPIFCWAYMFQGPQWMCKTVSYWTLCIPGFALYIHIYIQCLLHDIKCLFNITLWL